MIPLGVIAGSRRRPAGGAQPTFLGLSPLMSGATGTWVGAPLGTPSPGRTIIAAVMYWSGGTRFLESVTLGDDPMTWTATPAGSNAYTGFATLAAPAGTTATVGYVANGGLDAHIALWSIPTAIEYLGAGFTAPPSGAVSATLTVPASVAGGFVVGGFHSRSTAFTTAWTGIDADWDTADAQPSSGGHAATDGPGHAVTASFTPATSHTQTRLDFAAFRSAP